MVEQGQKVPEVNDLSQDVTTKLVTRILEKHGFKKENLKPISDSDKAHLKNLVEDLKNKLENLVQSQNLTTEPDVKQKSDKRTRKTK